MVTTLKRTAETIYETGGVIRKLDNLGKQSIPYKISAHNLVHKDAFYFIYKFDAPPEKLDDITDECNRDLNVVRKRVFKIQPPLNDPCTLESELQPPAYRKEVQAMLEISKKAEKKKFNPKTGITYYPFQWMHIFITESGVICR